MRCISPHRQYSIQIFGGQEQLVQDARGFGYTTTIREPVVAHFGPGGLMPHEELAAAETFTFSGLPEGVNPMSTIGIFDLEGYVQSFPEHERDALYTQMESRLRELQQRFPSQFICVDLPQAEPPWPSYDSMNAAEILKLQERLLVKPHKIREYEEQNKNRSQIVLAMLEIEDPEKAKEYQANLEPVSAEA